MDKMGFPLFFKLENNNEDFIFICDVIKQNQSEVGNIDFEI